MSPSTPNSRIAAAAHHDANGDSATAHSSNPLKRLRASPSLLETPNASDPSTAADDKATRDDRRQALLRDLYSRSERMINRFFHAPSSPPLTPSPPRSPRGARAQLSSEPQPVLSSRPENKSKRTINEDDYGDDDEDDEDEPLVDPPSLLGGQKKPHSHVPPSSTPSKPPLSSSLKPPLENGESASQTQDGESSEEVRKRLEGEKKAAEDAAIDSFQTMFYTLENDRDAMLDQQKLDELDRQVENEMTGPNAAAPGPEAQGTLSTTNLGASSLTLKHLFAQIDANRTKVKASDAKIRTLIGEVRKNRSKWASEDRVGQEELYEAAERVLMELKSMTDFAAPFLTKVKRADAPDYHRIIKDPMDLGTMMKKLSKAQYDSKKEFCDDLSLIWQNCLTYNTKSDHPFRRKAVHMQKETGRLIPLIPDIVIRDRKDIEREEQQLEQLDDANGSESDEDDRPIAATRGRKAPSKSSKGTAPSRKGLPGSEGAQDESDSKPKPTSNVLSTLRQDQLKPDADSADGSQHGLSTPPPGISTPIGANGHAGSAAPASHADPNELETLNASTIGSGLPAEEPDEEDEEYRIWKRVTKKDRARVASERHRLFLRDKLNPEEPALLRSKRGMRRWAKQQNANSGRHQSRADMGSAEEDNEDESAQGPLAEDISRDEDTSLPDYYEALAGIPGINSRLQWEVDNEGFAVDHRDDCLRLAPPGLFLPPASELTSKLDKNMRQMQDTRKVAAKIGIVKQMQVQTQTYQNQFQKYAPEPFHEADIDPLVLTDDGPFMNPIITRSALQRSVGKIFYSAGFEDFQPSALEAITDLASDYFSKVVRTLKLYTESRKAATVVQSPDGSAQTVYTPQFTPEAAVLHTLLQNGLELNEIESYIHETCNTLPGKLELHHSRMRDHYAELIRPALDPASVGTDGAGAFADGNETQFVAGDFAEDIDEDFFGFKELGLDREFGLASLSVPLHLLQSRMSNLYQPTDASAANASGNIMDTPPPFPPVTSDSIENEIGLVHDFFRERLEKTEDGHGPLIEDEELPAKQRFPKPRLPPNGKISSPRKRPLREQQMLARKRKRAEIEAERQRERELEEGTSAPNTAVEAAGRIGDSEPLAKMPRLTNGDSRGPNINGSRSNNISSADPASALANGASADKLKLMPDVDGDTASTDPEKKSKAGTNRNQDDQEDAEGDQDDRNGMLSPSLPIAAH